MQRANGALLPAPSQFLAQPEFVKHDVQLPPFEQRRELPGEPVNQTLRVERVAYKLQAHPLGIEAVELRPRLRDALGPWKRRREPQNGNGPARSSALAEGCFADELIPETDNHDIVALQPQFLGKSGGVVPHPVTTGFLGTAEKSNTHGRESFGIIRVG